MKVSETQEFSNRWIDEQFQRHGLVPPQPIERPVDFPTTVFALLEQVRADHGSQEALVDAHNRYTCASLFDAVENAAAALWSLGLRPGDRLVGSAANSADYVVAFLASQRLGLIWVGVNRALSAPEKCYVLEDSQASVMLGDKASIHALREFPECPPNIRLLTLAAGERCDWSDLLQDTAGQRAPAVEIDPLAPAAIAYTSGTTGRPKGAVHCQWNMLLFSAMAPRWRPYLKSGVRIAITLPLTTLNMFVLDVLPALSSGGTAVVIDKVDTPALAQWIRRERINGFATVPTIAYDLLTSNEIDPADLATLEAPIVGASMVPDALRQRYRDRFGSEVITGYGLTESPSTVTTTTLSPSFVPNSTGVALPHLEVTIRNEMGEALPVGQVGEVCVGARQDGPFSHLYRTTLGYWCRPDATEATLRGGVLHTGDLGCLNEEGELFIVDRKNDMIIRGGNNVYPAEIERVLSKDPRVAACAVIGVPDERLGQTVGALVQPAVDVDEQELLADLTLLVAKELARYKQPALWAVVDTFPRNQMGKIVKPAIALPKQWNRE